MLCVVALAVLVIVLVVWAAVQQDASDKETARAREAGLFVDDSLGLANLANPLIAGSCVCSLLSGIVAYMAARSRGANGMTAMNAGAGVVMVAICLCLCACVAFKVNMDMENDNLQTQPEYMMGEDGEVVMITPTPSAAS